MDKSILDTIIIVLMVLGMVYLISVITYSTYKNLGEKK